MSRRPIAIFDSGVGGLTVFREISKLLPHEDLLYLGDTARVPYGSKSAETVSRYAAQNARFLLDEGAKMIVVACNTASAFALASLQATVSVPVIGVIEPGVAGALRESASARIGVIGTEGTILSDAYNQNLLKRHPDAKVFSTPCPLFVPLVEEGWWSHEVTERIAHIYLDPLLEKNIDALILGCTHYPLLKNTLSKVTGPKIKLIDSAEETARETARLLTGQGLANTTSEPGMRTFCVTDTPERFRRVARMILDLPLTHIRHVAI